MARAVTHGWVCLKATVANILFMQRISQPETSLSTMEKKTRLMKNTTSLYLKNYTNPSRIYELKCNTCNKAYVGQTGRSIGIRHKEHISYIRTNNPQSAYAMHILQNRHEYGKIENTLQLLKTCKVHVWTAGIPYACKYFTNTKYWSQNNKLVTSTPSMNLRIQQISFHANHSQSLITQHTTHT